MSINMPMFCPEKDKVAFRITTLQIVRHLGFLYENPINKWQLCLNNKKHTTVNIIF